MMKLLKKLFNLLAMLSTGNDYVMISVYLRFEFDDDDDGSIQC